MFPFSSLRRLWTWAARLLRQRPSTLVPIIFSETAPLDLTIVGRMLFHAAVVGLAAGLVGAAFFAAIEYTQHLLLERLAGYRPLRASGETFLELGRSGTFHPILLVFLPAIGGLFCGLIARFVPEVRGGGADGMIETFHHRAGVVRRRVIWAKWLASLCTLGTGGAGGREGPTMLIGGALGSTVGGILGVSNRERRILLIAGVAAGIAAVFRTPLGAALLAVEILYRDGFESDALIPSVLASVVSYSVVIALFGESTLFAHAPRFPLVIGHLWLYAVLALLVALMAAVFLRVFREVRNLFRNMPGPEWLRPAVGGLLLGGLCVPIIAFVGSRIHESGQGLGILGGGYGAVQMAISGANFLSPGWNSVALLLLLSFVKLLASSLTIGSGGSAGDFAPSLAVGGLLGGAFGRAAQLLLQDPRLDAGAFALVGMGAFYGGIAHTPLAALVLVCEMAGNYDLLVPLMLAQGIAFVALRKRSLYEAQVPTQRDSPVHREALLLDLLKGLLVRDVASLGRPYVSLTPAIRGDEMLSLVRETTWQDVFPVLDGAGAMIGLISSETMHVMAVEQRDADWIVAADIMQSPVSIRATDNLRTATQRMIESELRELPVVDENQHIIGFLDETEITQAYLGASGRAGEDAVSPSR